MSKGAYLSAAVDSTAVAIDDDNDAGFFPDKNNFICGCSYSINNVHHSFSCRGTTSR